MLHGLHGKLTFKLLYTRICIRLLFSGSLKFSVNRVLYVLWDVPSQTPCIPSEYFSRVIEAPPVNTLPVTRNNQRRSPISLRILYMCIYICVNAAGCVCIYTCIHTRTVAIILSTIKVTLGPSSSCTKGAWFRRHRRCRFVLALTTCECIRMCCICAHVHERRSHSISRVYIYYLSIFFHLGVYIYINLPVRTRTYSMYIFICIIYTYLYIMYNIYMMIRLRRILTVFYARPTTMKKERRAG